MPVTELQSATVSPFDPRRRPSDRRPWREAPPHGEIPAPLAVDPGYQAPVFRPDLTQLTGFGNSHPAPEFASPVEWDEALVQLIAAVRDGDLSRARAAFEALETEMLVERSVQKPAALPAMAARARLSVAAGRLNVVAASAHAADDVYATLAHYLDADGLTF